MNARREGPLISFCTLPLALAASVPSLCSHVASVSARTRP